MARVALKSVRAMLPGSIARLMYMRAQPAHRLGWRIARKRALMVLGIARAQHPAGRLCRCPTQLVVFLPYDPHPGPKAEHQCYPPDPRLKSLGAGRCLQTVALRAAVRAWQAAVQMVTCSLKTGRSVAGPLAIAQAGAMETSPSSSHQGSQGAVHLRYLRSRHSNRHCL